MAQSAPCSPRKLDTSPGPPAPANTPVSVQQPIEAPISPRRHERFDTAKVPSAPGNLLTSAQQPSNGKVNDLLPTDAVLERVERNFQKLLGDIKRTFEELKQTSFTLMQENENLKSGVCKLDAPDPAMGTISQIDTGDIESKENDENGDFSGSSCLSLEEDEPHADAAEAIFPEWPISRSMDIQLRNAMMHSHQDDFLKLWDEVDEKEEALAGDSCIFSPVNRFRLSWDCASCLVLSLQLWIVPYSTVFVGTSENPWSLVFVENFTTLFFTVDMVLNFNTGIIRSTGESSVIIMDRPTIVREYLTGFFWIDLVSTIPFDRLMEHVDSNVFAMVRILRVARWMKLLRFVRMLNAVRIVRSLSKSFELEMQRLKNKILVPLITIIAVAFVSHLQGCLWAFLQPEVLDCSDHFSCYHDSFMRALLALLLGTRIGSVDATGGFAVLDLVVAVERLVLICICGLWLIYHALYHLKSYSKSERLMEDVLTYMELRTVSHKTQVHVLGQLNTASKIANVRRSYDAWIASGIPHELQRSICEELWLHRLTTMHLIKYVVQINPAIKIPLVMLVREETLAKHNVLFKEHDSPLGAYMILNGVLHVESSLVEEDIPPFTMNMWVGERALINPVLPRTLTAICKTICTLMAVPARGFQELLLEHKVLPQFENYVVDNLWHGICGRCGSVGDHFANECPKCIFSGKEPPTLDCEREDTGLSSLRENTLQSWIHGYSAGAGGASGSDSDGDSTPYVALRRDSAPPVRRDLKEYLYKLKLTQMLPVLNAHGVQSLAEMKDLTEDDKARILSGMQERQADDGLQLNVMALQQALELENVIDFLEHLEDRAKDFLGTTQKRAQHILFLSHHKLDGGTEASLLRHELETQIQMHPMLKRTLVDSPVFLDSEDLGNLEALQEHIANSQNILLLLTNDVLTRPWVLLELATAMKLGINILPVEVRKPGNQFAYPDEKFYEMLAAGKLLSSSSMRILQTYEVSLMQVEGALRKVFNCISFPYSPHRPYVFRKAEVEDILRNCHHKRGTGRKRHRALKRHKRSERPTMMAPMLSGGSIATQWLAQERRDSLRRASEMLDGANEERLRLLEGAEDETSESSPACRQQ